MDSVARLRAVTAHAKLAIDDEPVPLPSDSNDAWKIGDLVLRVCWRGDRTRLEREAVILRHLPAEVPHAELADAGVTAAMSWTLTRWVPGTMLSAVWNGLDARQQQTAAEQLGQALGALHAWDPSADIRAVIAARAPELETSAVIGADLNCLPVDRAHRLIEPAMHLENVDQQQIALVGEELTSLRELDPLRDPTAGVVVHGDAHLNNVIWDGNKVVALIDYEWGRLGPPDLELQPLLAGRDASAVIRSIIRAYPEMAAHPRFVDRLWLYDLAATLRDLHVKAPLPETNDLPAWHPKVRLPTILEGPGYIEALLNDGD